MPAPDLSRMTQAEAIAALQAQYANVGPFNPMDPYAGTGFSGDPQYARDVAPSYGNDKISGLQPNANGGFSGALTPSFDPMYPGGQYGSYSGSFDAQGNLDPASVQFTQDQRDHGWVSNNMPLITAAAIAGPAAYSMLGPGAGSAGWVSGESLPAGAMVGTDAAGYGGSMAGWVSGESLPTGFSGFDPSAGISGSTAPQVSLAPGSETGWVSGSDLPAGAMVGTDAAGYGGVTSGLTAATKAGGSILDGLGGAKGLAALAGGVAGALGGGPSESTTSRNVPEWAQQYGPDIVQRGQAIANTPFQPYTGQRYAGPNDATKQSWEMANQIAQGGPSAAQQISQGTFNRLQSGAAPDFGNAERINNQYIGQTTPGASNQYIGQNANSNVSGVLGGANPYTNQTTGSIGPLGQMNLAQTQTDVGRNALLGQNNPYLNDAISYATGDITRNFQNAVNPNLDRMARASGSFGNTGVEQAREEANRTLAQQIGRTTNDMRMADYALQAQLGEGDLGRRTNAALTDAQRNLGASQAQQQFNIGTDFARQQANLGYRAGDLGRSSTGFDAAQGRLLDAAKFDATNAQNNWQTNLGATSDLSKYNAGLSQADLARNAGLQSTQQQFNAGQGNFDITGARGDWNSAEGRAAQTMNAYQGYDQAATNRAALLGTVGAEMNRYAQQPLDFQNAEFMRQQQYPAQQLGVYQNAYNTGVNGQSVQSTPTGGNTAAQIAGGVATGVGLYNLFNQPQQQQQTRTQTFNPLTQTWS